MTKEEKKVYNTQWRKNWRAKDPLRAYRSKKASEIKALYGITIEYWDAMMLTQNYSCKLCGKHKDTVKQGLCVDHCHTTGKVRGLLCHTCNRALGLLKDNSNLLRKAATYVEQA